MARAAEVAGLDGVFTYDHLYRIGSAGHAPSLSLEPVLGALAMETSRIGFGPLVARAVVRHPATLAVALDSVARVAPGRLVAGVGTGDELSDPEQRMFGLAVDGGALRLGALDATVEAIRGRGFPVWIGGRSDRILATAAGLADGWNGWGLSPGAFALEVDRLRAACRVADRRPGEVTLTWGGLVELRRHHWDEARARPDVISGPFDAMAEPLRRVVDAGADWLILAPVDASDPENAQVVAEELRPRLSPR